MLLQFPHSTASPASARLLSTLLCTLLLSACASPLRSPNEASPAAAVQRQPASHFSLSARFSATAGENAASGLIDWQHRPGQEHIAFSSPLGQLLALLEADPQGAVLRSAGGERYQAVSAEALLPQLLGIELPLQRLIGWVQATPAADALIRERDAQGRPRLVIDQGWRIEYTRYQDERSAALPAILSLSRGDTTLRLAIDQWTLAHD